MVPSGSNIVDNLTGDNLRVRQIVQVFQVSSLSQVMSRLVLSRLISGACLEVRNRKWLICPATPSLAGRLTSNWGRGQTGAQPSFARPQTPNSELGTG